MKIIILVISLVFFSTDIINFFLRTIVGGTDFAFSCNKNNKKIKPFFFIHIPKNMGTVVHYYLPKSYNDKYYMFGYLNNKLLFTMRNHILIDDLIKHDSALLNLPMLAIIREPISRFISICNFVQLKPKYVISLSKRFGYSTYPSIFNLFNTIQPQIKFLTSQHNLNLQVFRLEDKVNIRNAFLKYDVEIDFDKKINKSKKTYSINDLDKDDLDFLNNYYHEDIKLYSRTLIGGINLLKS
ncbi:MAG: hypothetical protein H8E16_11625 [Flavobacteriales bacterium]|nr:hypothetical protein [Flavobacteriales bacterium]